MQRVLFVCTGNIFRSLTAEYALRRALGAASTIQVSSAGTEDFPHQVKPVVRDYLASLGLDVSAHQRRTLTPALVAEAGLVVAMNHDHQRFIREHFGRAAPLFTSLCGGGEEGLPDVEDVVADPEREVLAAAAHVRSTIDRIVALAPLMARRLQAPG